VTTTSEDETRMRGVDVQVRGVIHLYEQDGPDIVALRGIDLDIGAGEMVALLGPSGMGKSTLMQLMAGVMRPSAGHIRVGDVDLGQLSPAELRRLRASEVSFVLQDTGQNLLPYATAVENVWFAQQGNRRGREIQDPLELLTRLGLADMAHHRVGDLPGGQQQLVALASGVGSSPRLLLADEPTNQLDSEAATQVIALLHAINRRLGTTVVLVTHDPVVAAALPRTVTIRDGRVGAEGRRGVQYAVVDGSGSVQLPSEVIEHFPPLTRLIVRQDDLGIHLSPADPEGRDA
jgi:putative ABC transport system ATP-binding protein